MLDSETADVTTTASSEPRATSTRRESIVPVWVVASLSGAFGALAGCAPTGSQPIDRALGFLAAAAVAWAGATAPSWALVAAAGAAAAVASGAPLVVLHVAWIALAAAIASSLWRPHIQVVGALVAAAVVQVCMRLAWSPFLGASALVGGVVCALLLLAGITGRPRATRRRAWRLLLAVAGVVVVAAGGLAAAGAQARRDASAGYRQMLDGLDLVRSGRVDEAATVLRAAAGELRAAASDLDAPWAQPSRLLPAVAQNRAVAADLLDSAARAGETAADLLADLDLDALGIDRGVIDIAAVEAVAEPLRALAVAIDDLTGDLAAADSPWLVGPLRDRLASATRRAGIVGRQSDVAATAVEHLPAMLGRDEPRRYLLAFGTPAEARGQSGLLGNWSELTMSAGRLQVTDSGRISDLMELTASAALVLDATPEFFERYGFNGAGAPGEPVRPAFWQNVTMSPDMPSVGGAMSQMYEAVTGRPVDGVFVLDPRALAALLDVTGAVVVPGLAAPLDSTNVEQFLLLDQYATDKPERVDLLEQVTNATVAKVLTSALPGPQQLARALAPAALEGHLSAYAVRAEEQAMLELVGMDARLPRLDGEASGADALAVVTQNAGGNKIDTFLERQISYEAVHDRGTGEVTADLEIRLDNSAPATGYPPYVISNLVGIPDGTNRMILSVFTPLSLTSVSVDGVDASATAEHELGYNVYSVVVDVPSHSHAVVRVGLTGSVTTGDYRLVYRPQPLPTPDGVSISVTTSDGTPLVAFDGTLARRSVIRGATVEAWR